MCIIAYSPAGVEISKQKLENCWSTNDDGAGIMYSVDNKIIVKKEMTNFETFYEYYKEALEANTNVVMHFRISTSGGVNELNCHPFRVHKGLWFCHNGVLSVEVPKDSKINDTQIFNEKYLKPLPEDFIKQKHVLDLIELAIGSYNKFVFLDSDGNVAIVNEKAGNWNEGAWFSNYTYNTSSYYKGGYNNSAYGGYGTSYNNGYYNQKDKDSSYYNNTHYKNKKSTIDEWEDEYYYGESYRNGSKSKTGTGVDINDDGALWDECGICGDLSLEASLSYLKEYNVWGCGECNKWVQKEVDEYKNSKNKGVY